VLGELDSLRYLSTVGRVDPILTAQNANYQVIGTHGHITLALAATTYDFGLASFASTV
jgi:hypothetical protein